MAVLVVGCTADAAGMVPMLGGAVEPVSDVEPVPGGEACTTSCARPEPGGDELTEAEFGALLAGWLAEPIDAPTLPLETLLFHGERTRGRLAGAVMSPERRAFLNAELDRNRAAVEMRLVDDAGVVRGVFTDSGLVLGEGCHGLMTGTGSLGAVQVSGRVKRVGLDHLWSRW
jgi:hypothetical protein